MIVGHCGLPRRDQVGRIAALGMVPVTQPGHHHQYGDGVVRAVLVDNAEPVEYGQVLFRTQKMQKAHREPCWERRRREILMSLEEEPR